MNRDEILAYLEMIEELSRLPLYNSLEVGFRHNPLTVAEKLERYELACTMINGYACHIMEKFNGNI